MFASLRFGTPVVLLGALAAPLPVDACAVAPPRDAVVEVASESAIIVWDERAKTEHFIRRATFAAAAPGRVPVKDFGFLVPTPSVPALEEADDTAFDELAKLTAPKTETRPLPTGGGCAIGCGAMAPAARPATDGHTVEVLAVKSVAGYDAQVLKAADADALAAWLKDHGYDSRPALAAWLKPYVEKKWVVTAFKISTSAAAASAPVGSGTVRMSFNTDAPVYPYREPDDLVEAKGGRVLRLFFVADQKVAGALDGGAAWGANTAWAGKPGAEGWKGVVPHLKLPGWAPGEGTWLTEFEDRASTRKGKSDLTFKAAADQTPKERPTRIVYAARTDAGPAPALAMIAAAAACLYATRFLTRLAGRRG